MWSRKPNIGAAGLYRKQVALDKPISSTPDSNASAEPLKIAVITIRQATARLYFLQNRTGRGGTSVRGVRYGLASLLDVSNSYLRWKISHEKASPNGYRLAVFICPSICNDGCGLHRNVEAGRYE